MSWWPLFSIRRRGAGSPENRSEVKRGVHPCGLRSFHRDRRKMAARTGQAAEPAFGGTGPGRTDCGGPDSGGDRRRITVSPFQSGMRSGPFRSTRGGGPMLAGSWRDSIRGPDGESEERTNRTGPGRPWRRWRRPGRRSRLAAPLAQRCARRSGSSVPRMAAVIIGVQARSPP